MKQIGTYGHVQSKARHLQPYGWQQAGHSGQQSQQFFWQPQWQPPSSQDWQIFSSGGIAAFLSKQGCKMQAHGAGQQSQTQNMQMQLPPNAVQQSGHLHLLQQSPLQKSAWKRQNRHPQFSDLSTPGIILSQRGLWCTNWIGFFVTAVWIGILLRSLVYELNWILRKRGVNGNPVAGLNISPRARRLHLSPIKWCARSICN